MGTPVSTTSPCCGRHNTPRLVQSDIKHELKSHTVRYNKAKNKQNGQEQQMEEKILDRETNKHQVYENKKANYKTQRKKRNLRTSQSVDSYSMRMPKQSSILTRQARSFSNALSDKHRYQLNLKRKSSLLIRRAKKDFTLPFRINQICTVFLNYIIENNLIDNKEMDLFGIEITYAQFNIVLNNNQIELSPDMAAALIWTLLDINNMIDSKVKSLGLEKDNNHTEPMKERSFHQKQFKVITKCKITYKMIKYLMEQLNNSNIVSSWDKIAQPKNLTYKKRNFVIWDKILKNLLNKTSFNAENDYLYGVLTEEDMSDTNKIIDMLSSLQSHWKHRIQIMKYIDNQISSEQATSTTILTDINNDIFIKLLNGWSVQLSDDRSAVSRTAIALLPTVLSSLLLSIQHTVILFDKENIMDPMFNGIFVLIKNKRLKDLAEDAYESFIQIIDIFTEIATDLEDYAFLKMVIELLDEHSNQSTEKHFKVREACIGGIGFVLFGADNENVKIPMEAINENDDDIKLDQVGHKCAAKLSMVMQRKHLIENEEFVKCLGYVLKNGITDKNELCRKKGFELLEKLDNDSDQHMLEEMSAKWDFIITKKYNTYKRMQQRKHEKKKSLKRIAKKSKKKKKHKETEGKQSNAIEQEGV